MIQRICAINKGAEGSFLGVIKQGCSAVLVTLNKFLRNRYESLPVIACIIKTCLKKFHREHPVLQIRIGIMDN